MKRLTKTYQAIIFFTLFAAAVYFCVPSANYNNCLATERFKKTAFEGVVINKYRDRSNHSIPIAELRTSNNSIERVHLFGERSGLFNQINSGDSLKKSTGTNEILRKIDGAYVKFGYANFNCDSEKMEKEKYLCELYDFVGTIPKPLDQND